MKKALKPVYFCLPVVIYIACSLLAFLLWNVFNHAADPVISTSIILCVVGSLLCGFASKGKPGKNGMILAIAVSVAGTVLWIIAYTFDLSPVAYVATALSSYLFNIYSTLPIDMQITEYYLYIGYAISFAVPVILILLGRFLRVKILKGKA